MESGQKSDITTSGVQFNNEDVQTRIVPRKEGSRMVRSVINHSGGLVKNAQQANAVLVIAILSLLVSGFIFWQGAEEPPLLPPVDDPV